MFNGTASGETIDLSTMSWTATDWGVEDSFEVHAGGGDDIIVVSDKIDVIDGGSGTNKFVNNGDMDLTDATITDVLCF